MNAPKKCWAPDKVRPIVKLLRVREYVYVFAATCPMTGETYSLIMPACNTDAMEIFLDGLSQQYQNYRNIILADQAAWHVTEKLPEYDNIRWIRLPPGSPELNPEEHLWEHIREKYLGNRIYNSLDEMEKELVNILQAVSAETQTIRSLTNFSWLNAATPC